MQRGHVGDALRVKHKLGARGGLRGHACERKKITVAIHSADVVFLKQPIQRVCWSLERIITATKLTSVHSQVVEGRGQVVCGRPGGRVL